MEAKKKTREKKTREGKKNNEARGVCEREVKRLRQEVESERMKRHRRVGGGNHSERNSFFWQWEPVNKRV